MKYRRLTIDQAKQGLQAGYELLAADGNVSFPSAVMHAPLNLPCSTLHRATFNHLRAKGLIRLNEAKSRIPKVVFYDRSQNWYAVWQWNGKDADDKLPGLPILQCSKCGDDLEVGQSGLCGDCQ